jgi:hypothetical protein
MTTNSIWIHANSQSGYEGIAQKQRLRVLIDESRTEALRQSSEQGHVSLTNVRSECGNRFPWKILADGDADLSEVAKELHTYFANILGPNEVLVTDSPS